MLALPIRPVRKTLLFIDVRATSFAHACAQIHTLKHACKHT